MKIAIGADHGGYEMKEQLKAVLVELGHEAVDVGCHSTASVDYPDFAAALSEQVVSGSCPFGILICGTGIGMSIAVNRDPKIRAALCHDEFTARLSREHNNANVLCLGARVTGPGLADAIVRTWLNAAFEGGRHQIRVSKYSN
ncbi:ribose 5-phosphate isomerase B [Desulfopila aestuarii]|uniref:Ribose 5-phosphate isomerase B n=1 Tax=Desulfopila aestuarii DSM 18488 TaxID=1121416 RepID=A0A1M7YEG6_9BACT|nr:ribose 5-phosphate isomerase B [Desulfopila aestuarii]SHO51020.1 ribose 5-phosphate isomerase B [Desulfopila aestuarii DSM 18488]